MSRGPARADTSSPERFWFRVEASLRRVEPEERPAWCLVPDDRMVVYGELTPSGVWAPRAAGLYSPLATPTLCPDFMRLFGAGPLPRDQRVLGFYGQYGALDQKTRGDGPETSAWLARVLAHGRRPRTGEARLGFCEPLWWVAEQAREMRLCYDVYQALVGDDLASLRAMLGEVPQGEEVRGVRLAAAGLSLLTAEAEPPPTRPGRRVGSAAVERPAAEASRELARRPLTEEECSTWGYRMLAERFTAVQQQSSVKWMLDAEGARPRLVQSRTFPDLVVAMYLQLAELVAAGQLYRTCEACGGPFWAKPGKQRFCDRQCGDAWRQRHRYRDPNWQAARPSTRPHARRPKAID
jgi:hypothetical protein